MDISKIVLALQNIREDKLTIEIIIPILKRMNYLKVEYNGGSYDHGKDIIIWQEDEFKDLKLKLVQVKHFKPSNRAADPNSFQTVVNQLIACSSKEVIYTDRTIHLPSELILITSFDVSNYNLESRFGSHPSLRELKLKIVDGPKLAKLIIDYYPECIKDLIGVNYEINTKIKPVFNNNVLLKALGRSELKDIKTIYTDIDFSLGRISTRLFFSSKMKPKKETLKFNYREWSLFKEICTKIKKEFSLDFMEQSIDEIEAKIQKNNRAIERINESISILNNQIELEKINLKNSQKQYNLHSKKVSLTLVNIEVHYNEAETINKKNKQDKGFLSTYSSSWNTRLKELKEIESYEKSQMHFYKDEVSKIEKLIDVKKFDLKNLRSEESKYFIKINLDGEKLVNEIIEKRVWIEKKVSYMNNKKPSTQELKQFILDCNSIIDVVSVILDLKNVRFFDFLGIDKTNTIREDYESTRLKLTIDQIFDTGINLAVLGDAGAGKSTSIEMYAWNRIDSNKIIILAPLGRVIQKYNVIFKEDINEYSTSILERYLFEYIKSMGIELSFLDFKNMLSKEKVVLLLDGLDEAIKQAHWLPTQIKKLSERYHNVQIILSSRMHGNYLERIPFFTITLLPFTIEQRDVFIKKWFEKDIEYKEIVDRIFKHLKNNKSISEIIRNPLLTTTLCVLAEHKLTLPKTEIKLYDERINLYTGYYDNVKHINIRCLSTPSNLKKLAQKLAFYLHCNNKREESIELLESKAIKSMANLMNKEDAKTAFYELIDPCEIIIPITSDGKYGFGHLRYQEHLAAEQLSDRSIDIIPFLNQQWWYGALMLFSRMNDNLEWFIKLVGSRGQISLPIISEIINSRNLIEKKNLQSLVDNYKMLKTGEFDEAFIDYSVQDSFDEYDMFEES